MSGLDVWPIWGWSTLSFCWAEAVCYPSSFTVHWDLFVPNHFKVFIFLVLLCRLLAWDSSGSLIRFSILIDGRQWDEWFVWIPLNNAGEIVRVQLLSQGFNG